MRDVRALFVQTLPFRHLQNNMLLLSGLPADHFISILLDDNRSSMAQKEC